MNAPLTRCDEVPWSLIGVSLAGWNAIASVIMAAVAVPSVRSGCGGPGA